MSELIVLFIVHYKKTELHIVLDNGIKMELIIFSKFYEIVLFFTEYSSALVF